MKQLLLTPLLTFTSLLAGIALTAQTYAPAGQHTTKITGSGTVRASGYNSYGELGNGNNIDSDCPVNVSSLTGVTAVVNGENHSMALKSDGTVWTWGFNYDGELGTGTSGTGTDKNTPVQVSGLAGVTKIACGQFHSLALKSDGTVWTWGSNFYYELGDGTDVDKYTPVQATGLSGAIDISAGLHHSAALMSDGTVWVWGINSFGALGLGTSVGNSPVPTMVPGLTGVIAISCGYRSTLALKSDGTVWTWGYGNWGQQGDGTTTDRYDPTQIMALSGIDAITSGNNSCYAIKNDGSVWVWGYNVNGTFGNGSTADSYFPIASANLNGFTEIRSKGGTTMGMKAGTLWVWGRNDQGQYGNGNETNSQVPIAYGTCSPAAVAATVAPAGITALPNPATSMLIVQGRQAFEHAIIKVMNIAGETMMTLNDVTGPNAAIDISTLAAGMYILEVTDAGSTEKIKIIKN